MWGAKLTLVQIQLSLSTLFRSIYSLDRTQSGVTTPGQSEPGRDGTAPSYCLVSYQATCLEGGSYPSAEKQSVYYTALADWARTLVYMQRDLSIVFYFIHYSIFKSFKKFFTHCLGTYLLKLSNKNRI